MPWVTCCGPGSAETPVSLAPSSTSSWCPARSTGRCGLSLHLPAVMSLLADHTRTIDEAPLISRRLSSCTSKRRQVPVDVHSVACICAVPDLGESVEGGLVGVGQGVKVALRRPQASVAKSLFHDLEVGAASEQPRCVRMPQIV